MGKTARKAETYLVIEIIGGWVVVLGRLVHIYPLRLIGSERSRDGRVNSSRYSQFVCPARRACRVQNEIVDKELCMHK